VDEIAGVGTLLDRTLGQQLGHPLDTGSGGEHVWQQVTELADRPVALGHQGQEREKSAQGQPVGGQRPGAKGDHA
jgi:hypothetical protein